MQLCEKFNAMGLRLLSLKSPACKTGLWLTSGNMDLGKVSAILKLLRVAQVPKLFVETIWLKLNACFPSGILELWYMLGREWLCGQHATSSLGPGSLPSLSGRQYFLCAVTALSWNETCPVCLHSGEEWELVPGACWLHPMALFLCWFCCVSFCCNKS